MVGIACARRRSIVISVLYLGVALASAANKRKECNTADKSKPSIVAIKECFVVFRMEVRLRLRRKEK